MLFEAKLSKHFWGEALYTVMRVINLSPIVAWNSEVPNKIGFDKVEKSTPKEDNGVDDLILNQFSRLFRI